MAMVGSKPISGGYYRSQSIMKKEYMPPAKSAAASFIKREGRPEVTETKSLIGRLVMPPDPWVVPEGYRQVQSVAGSFNGSKLPARRDRDDRARYHS